MPNEDSDLLGAMQNPSLVRRSSENVQDYCGQRESSISSYLILSPSNPLRTFAISFLTHWIYSAVIVVTICAFLTSSSYRHYSCDQVQDLEDANKEVFLEFLVFLWTRRILLICLLLEVLIKSLARGFIVGSLSFLRIGWDWLDVISLIFLFVSIIKPWKAIESLAAAIILLKLIPIHSGSISAFNSLCSCAKKLFPVLAHGIIIVWIYGVVIFMLFVKYQQDRFQDAELAVDATFSKTNGSASDSVENGDITTQKSPITSFVDGLYPTPSTGKKSQNFSFELSVECLPTNLRSLSGSLIQASQMLTLGFSLSDLKSTILRGNTSNLDQLELLCQYEIYALSIVETFVIISGTLPIIAMTFAALYDFFQTESHGMARTPLLHQDDNQTEQESQASSYQFQQRRRLGSGISGRSNISHSENYRDEGSSCLSSLYKQIANILCDCDYYFCCLANLQRRLNPNATRLLNSVRFKVCLLLVVSLDFLCMIMLLWFPNSPQDETIDFSSTSIIIYCVQICFILYTIEVVLKWFAISSDEYWRNIWSAFDLCVIIAYWIGYGLIHVRSQHSFYRHLCGVLTIRMLKVVPYWNSLQTSLKVVASSFVRKFPGLFVILVCSFSITLLKISIEFLRNSVNQPTMKEKGASTLYLHLLLTHFSNFILYFLCFAVIIFICVETIGILNVPQERQRVNTSVSFLLNDSHSEELTNMLYQPRRSLNESASPISIMSFPDGISHMKFSPYNGSSNGHLSQETPLSPNSDVLSPLLSIPVSNGLNSHVQPLGETCLASDDANYSHADNSGENRKNECNSSLIELFMDMASSGTIILSCMNKVLGAPEINGFSMDWSTFYVGKSLWLEALFIVFVASHIIYKTRLSRFSREAFLQISCMSDLLVVLAAITEVFGSGMSWLPLKSTPKGVQVFVGCAKVITACRGLLLFSRISWLKHVGRILCQVIAKVLPYLTSYGYVWCVFVISTVEAQMLIASIKTNPRGRPENNINESLNNSFEKIEKNAENDNNSIANSALMFMMISLFTFTFGGFIGILIHKMGGWSGITSKFFSNYSNLKSSTVSANGDVFSSVTRSNKPTEGICIPVLYFVTTHPNFDIIVMTFIVLDGLEIALEYLATSERALILRRHYPAYILFLYLLELSCKFAGNGLSFFKSNWNVLDSILTTFSIVGYFASLIGDSTSTIAFLLLDIRFFRVVRIFQFLPFTKRADLIHYFFSSVSKTVKMLWDFSIFYCSLFLIAVIFRLRCAQFISTLHNPFYWIAAPFQLLIEPVGIFEILENLKHPNFSISSDYALFVCCLTLFSLIRICAIFCVWLILVSGICYQTVRFQDHQICQNEVYGNGRSQTLRDDVEIDDQAPLDDKCFDLEPVGVSPETLDIETPGCSGINNNLTKNDTTTATFHCAGEPSTSGNPPQNSLYKTRTITSSEEINGCKVFYVELITTV